jgi:LacI family transcriptional regulator
VPGIAKPSVALLAAKKVAVAAGYVVVIWSSRNIEKRELACFGRFCAGYIDGLILIANRVDDGWFATRVAEARGRVVIVADGQADALRIFVENEQGGYLATRDLIDMSHRRIVHVGGPARVMSAIERGGGRRRVLAEADGAAPREWHFYSECEFEPAHARACDAFSMRPPPPAMFAGTGVIALGVLTVAHHVGIRVPQDLSSVGFDVMPIVELLEAQMTSIAPPFRALGRLSAECLVTMIDGSGDPDPPVVLLPVELVSRDSVALPKDLTC